MSQPFRIGIAGLGTVGSGVVKIVQSNADLLAARAGRPIEIVAVSARSKKDRGVDLSPYEWVDNPQNLAERHDVDAVVELIGGSDGPAFALVKKALEHKKHVVSANKALLAHHGYELAVLAEKNNASLMYEAAVAGGVPAIKALREGLAANRITAVYGILNGTCNYILTQMRETGRDFADVLKEAQAKGYAEADPAFDIDGVDAGHKICILSAIAFGVKPKFEGVKLAGIRTLTSTDIVFAQELGFKIKLLGIAKDYNGKITIAVEPCLVPSTSPLGAIEDVYNAVFVEGNFVETPLFTGRGAGSGPTASAVVADIIDLARGISIPTFGIPAKNLKEPQFLDVSKKGARYYLRLTVYDQPGVLADVSAILRDHKISIEGLLQRGRDPGQPVPVVITTHSDTLYTNITESVKLINKLKCTVQPACLMRIEDEL
jgi:homoserine dehydrogenase